MRAKLLREASGSGNDPLEGTTSIHNLQSEWQLFLKDSMRVGALLFYLSHRYGLQVMDYEVMTPEHSEIDRCYKFVFVKHWETVMLSYQDRNAGSLLETKEKYTSAPAANAHIVFDNLQISNSKI